jgi:AcrR family transcriptional regulator
MATTGTRERIIEAAAALLAEGGREAVSTRAVSASAPYRPSGGPSAVPAGA